jgi:hypothetical protein
MPFSYSSQISGIIGFVEELKPTTILDIGIGTGQYGFLCRNYLESVNLFNRETSKKRDKSEWKFTIDGIEVFEEYITPVHHYVYNRLFFGEACEILKGLEPGGYELILAVDILEHFYKDKGKKFIAELKRVGRRSLVSTPKQWMEQDIPQNPFENHRSLWTKEDLIRMGAGSFLDDPLSWIGIFKNEKD